MAVPKAEKKWYHDSQQEARLYIKRGYVKEALEHLAQKGITRYTREDVYNVVRVNSGVHNWELLEAIRIVSGLPARAEKQPVQQLQAA